MFFWVFAKCEMGNAKIENETSIRVEIDSTDNSSQFQTFSKWFHKFAVNCAENLMVDFLMTVFLLFSCRICRLWEMRSNKCISSSKNLRFMLSWFRVFEARTVASLQATADISVHTYHEWNLWLRHSNPSSEFFTFKYPCHWKPSYSLRRFVLPLCWPLKIIYSTSKNSSQAFVSLTLFGR